MAFESGGDYAHPALVTRALREMAAAGVQGIVWSGGGEPTTHPQWPTLLDAAADAGLKQGMYTFGGLLRQDTARRLADRVEWVVVSLDCVDAETYSAEKGVPPDRFAAACEGARWLAEAGACTVGVSFLLHQANWMRAGAMVELARSLGASYAMLRPTIETSPDRPSVCTGDRRWIDAARPMLEELARDPFVVCDPSRFAAYRDWRGRAYETCHGIKLNATVTPDGRVWVCPQRRGIAGSEIGDLRRDSFTDIWARHPGQWTDFSGCRAMCRLHLVNERLAEVLAPYAHEAFV
jgi:MoaA/NifB/PqqE/SkfB family radical SAM enzyme